jgi:hypothetical protein
MAQKQKGVADAMIEALLTIAAGRHGVGLALGSGDLLRDAMAADHLRQKPLGRSLISMLRQEEIAGLPHFIPRPIKVVPLPLHANIWLVHPPTDPYRARAAVQGFLQRRAVLHDPAQDSRVDDWHSTLLHQFFDMVIAQGVRHLPSDTHENDGLREMGALDANHLCSPSLVQSKFHKEILPAIMHE